MGKAAFVHKVQIAKLQRLQNANAKESLWCAALLMTIVKMAQSFEKD